MNKALIAMATTAMIIAGCGPKAEEKVPAINLANLDTSYAPGQNFYMYATGGWQKAHPLTAEYARFGTFDELRENNITRINDLFKEMAAKTYAAGTDEQKISDLYKAGLDSVRLNKEGAAPLQPYLAKIAAAGSVKDLVDIMARNRFDGFFGGYVGADLTNSDMQIYYLGQSGLGMGNRDYYTLKTNDNLKAGYLAFLKKIFALAGYSDPDKAAENALGVEQTLAEHQWTSVQERDIQAGWNPCSTAELEAKYPGIPFKEYFAGYAIPDQDKLSVGETDYFAFLSDYLPSLDLQKAKDYVAGLLIQGACGYLSDDFYKASFDFFSTQMRGVTQQRPRWKRAMSVPDGILGEAVGKMYVAKYFPESSKQKMIALVKNLQTALGEHIDSLDWMGDSTKAKAREKLSKYIIKVGYPDKWKDYSKLSIDPARSYYDNLVAASEWSLQDNLSKLGKPTDKTEWGMTPQTVNAYYNPTTNEICFPAAILQPPFFNPDADDPVNYGAIGVVIGHEMSHGFDDQGSQFDGDGNMNNWWTPQDAALFHEKGEKLAAQFDSIEVLPGLHANGHLTLGENIGDHGGLSIAYTAMENAIAGKPRKLIDGFTPEQRFYIAYATVWAQNITDEQIKYATTNDPHSIAVNRVNASLKNFQTFFDAFGIKEGDPMYMPESERVHIW